MVLNSVQRQVGSDNFKDAVRISRRQVLSGAVALPTAAGMYFGYEKLNNEPVRVGVIGTGDQGNAHISSMNPDYCRVVAFSEIRPSNQTRTWQNLNEKFGEDAKNIKLYEDYNELINDQDVEMVIVATPLHLHHDPTVKALRAGKHVLCEKLMAKTVAECKDMVKVADETRKLLGIGHQRHYSYLYANCLALIQQGTVLGDIRHIRSYWHRNQTRFGAEGAEDGRYDGWFRQIPEEDLNVEYARYGYRSLEELVRWRLHDTTGAGLMAELGSHQLDACSIFLGKARPEVVMGSGVVSFFKDGRDVEDHIFLTFEFGEASHKAVVTYSSIGTNMFDGYGEQVMGTRGTLIVQEERDAYLFREGTTKDTRVSWAEDFMARPVVDSGSTAQWVTGIEVPDTLVSRGYREEQEHMAWLIRNPELIVYPSRSNPFPEKKDPAAIAFLPRCHGRVGLDDAVIALTANLAMARRKRVEFKDAWFEPYSDSVPEDEV